MVRLSIEQEYTAPRYGILYKRQDQEPQCIFVAETKLNRNMSQIAKMATGTNIITFQDTTRELAEDAITLAAPSSVVLNEGLERLGAKETRDGWEYEGRTFSETAIESIRIPSTLKRIEEETF